jgi:fructose-specific PTS system IIA-like component
MFPLISTVREFRQAKMILADVIEDLHEAGVPFRRDVPTGMMVEVPAACMLLDHFVDEADFFSIGSNDLAQYFFAADRENERVSHLYSPLHPAFLRLLSAIVEGAHREGRWIGLCGEMGRDPIAAPLLAGLGLDEISLASPGISAVKSVLARSRADECRALLDASLAKESAGEVETLLRAHAESKSDRRLASRETVRLRARSGSREEAVRELVDLLHVAGRVGDPDRFEEAVWRREETASTAVGFGVALPHARSADVRVNSIALLRFDRPVAWGPGETEPVRMALLIAVADGAPGDAHLRLIASLSRRLVGDEFREALLSAPDEEEAARRIVEAASR